MDAHELSDESRTPFQLGDWLVDPMSGRLSRDGAQVSLEPRIMELLVFLVNQQGRVAAKSEILDRVWRGRFVVESVLTRAVSLLRAALGDSARQPAYIETIPRRGYRVIAPIRRHGSTQAAMAGKAPAARWTLRGDAGQIILAAGETIIGRGDEAQVLLDSDDVSRRHARIELSGERAVLVDLGSKNGTFLNGERLAAPAVLKHLDVIVVASVRLIVHAAPRNVETASAAP